MPRYQPRTSLALRVRSPTWVVLSALAERVESDGTVRVFPGALARTLGLTDQNVLEAIGELIALDAVRVVGVASLGPIVLDISGALPTSPSPNTDMT